MAGYDPNDRRGKEGIDLSDYGFTAVVTPQGLLNGLGAFEMVAGAGFEAANELVNSWAVSKQFSATGLCLKNPRRPLPNWQDSELLKD
jgi:hypothetical protein